MDTVGKRLLQGESMASTIESDPISLNNMLHTSVHCVWTGTPTGDIYYEISGDIGTPTNWEVYDSQAVAGAGTQYWVDRNVPYMWLRVRYEPSAGAGNLDVDVVTKGDL